MRASASRSISNRWRRFHRWRQHTRHSTAWLIAIALALIPTSALAAEVVTGSDVHIFVPTDGDLYAVGSDVWVTGDVDGDLIALGVRVTIEGDVHGDVLAAGADVLIVGTVDGSVSAAGGTVSVVGDVGRTVRIAAQNARVIDAIVGGDVAALARVVRVIGDGRVDGDVLLRTSDARVHTDVGGSVRGHSTELELSGVVSGSVRVHTDRLRLINGAQTLDTLIYTSDRDVHIDGASSAAQTPERLDPDRTTLSERAAMSSVWAILRAGWGLVLGLVLLNVAPQLVRGSARQVQERPLGSVGYGLLGLLGIPVAITLMLITIVGIPVALIVTFLFIVALYTSQIVVGYALGALALQHTCSLVTRRRPHLNPPPIPANRDGLALAIGVLSLAVLRSLPIELWYPFVAGMTAIVGLGAFSIQLYRMRSGADLYDL